MSIVTESAPVEPFIGFIENGHAVRPALVALVSRIVLWEVCKSRSVLNGNIAVFWPLKHIDGRISNRRAIRIQRIHKFELKFLIDGNKTSLLDYLRRLDV